MEKIDVMDVSLKWKQRFKLFYLEENGLEYDEKEYNAAHRNLAAFIFGPFAYLYYGMWTKGLMFFTFLFLYVCVLGFIEQVFSISIPSAVYSGASPVAGMTINKDFYRTRFHGEKIWPQLAFVSSPYIAGANLVGALALFVYMVFSDFDYPNELQFANDQSTAFYSSSLDSNATLNIAQRVEQDIFPEYSNTLDFYADKQEGGIHIKFPVATHFVTNPYMIAQIERFKTNYGKSRSTPVFTYIFGGVHIDHAQVIPCKDKSWCKGYQVETWMGPHSVGSSFEELKGKVEHELEFFHDLFQWGMENENETVEWKSIPTAFVFASNGIALEEYDLLENWIQTFAKAEDSFKAYEILTDLFRKAKWPRNKGIFESQKIFLSQMLVNARSLKQP